MKTDDIYLENCPFCGKKVRMVERSYSAYAGNYYDNSYLTIPCATCQFEMKIYPKGLGCTEEEKQELVDRWNRRSYK